MSVIINIYEAKTQFSRLLQRVATGEEVIIARAGKPIAKLVPIAPQNEARTLGSAKGQVWMSDDFDAPLPEEVLDEFYK